MEKENIYFISERPAAANHAGNKARIDVENILSNMNFEPMVHVEERDFSSRKEYYKYIFSPSYIKTLYRLSQAHHKILFIQYPFYYDRRLNQYLRNCIKNNNTILIIHDILALRSVQKDEKRFKKEIKCFNDASALIVHNHKMKDWLINNGGGKNSYDRIRTF